jgi:hypothetical protein
MREESVSPATDRPLVALAYELLDAHLDTVELMPGWVDELGWKAHLDYLRGLVRTAEEMLAEASSADVGPAAPEAARSEKGP